MRRAAVSSLLVGFLSLVIVACGATSAPSSAPSTPPAAAGAKKATVSGQTSGPVKSAAPSSKISVRLGFLAFGPDDPFILAKQRGYYSQSGLDVSIHEGKGSTLTGQTVASGRDQFGVIDAATAAALISKGAPIKVLAVFLQKSPNAFIHNPSTILRSPKDLRGRTIITSAASETRHTFQAILTKYGMNESDVKLRLVQPRSQALTFVRTPGAVLLGTVTGNYAEVLKLDPKAVANLYANFGVSTYSIGLVTSLSEIKHHAGVVQRFVAASIKGWNAALKDPPAAAHAAVKEFPRANYAMELHQLTHARSLLHTPATKGHPLGWMSQSDWRETLSILHKYAGVSVVKPVHDYYTNRFLPSS